MATTKTAKKPAKTAAPKAATPAAAPSTAEPMLSAMERRNEIVGTVVSDKMQKTIVVRVDRRVLHPFYKKYVKKTSRVKAHDEKNTAKIGDQVQLVETRPMSKEKRWALKRIVRKATIQTVDAAV